MPITAVSLRRILAHWPLLTPCHPRPPSHRCLSNAHAVKQLSLRHLPPLLVFHAKRFEHAGGLRAVAKKLDTYLSFPLRWVECWAAEGFGAYLEAAGFNGDNTRLLVGRGAWGLAREACKLHCPLRPVPARACHVAQAGQQMHPTAEALLTLHTPRSDLDMRPYLASAVLRSRFRLPPPPPAPALAAKARRASTGQLASPQHDSQQQQQQQQRSPASEGAQRSSVAADAGGAAEGPDGASSDPGQYLYDLYAVVCHRGSFQARGSCGQGGGLEEWVGWQMGLPLLPAACEGGQPLAWVRCPLQLTRRCFHCSSEPCTSPHFIARCRAGTTWPMCGPQTGAGTSVTMPGSPHVSAGVESAVLVWDGGQAAAAAGGDRLTYLRAAEGSPARVVSFIRARAATPDCTEPPARHSPAPHLQRTKRRCATARPTCSSTHRSSCWRGAELQLRQAATPARSIALGGAAGASSQPCSRRTCAQHAQCILDRTNDALPPSTLACMYM